MAVTYAAYVCMQSFYQQSHLCSLQPQSRIICFVTLASLTYVSFVTLASLTVCTGAVYWSMIEKVFYAATNEDVSRGGGFETAFNVFEGDEHKKSPADRTRVPFVSPVLFPSPHSSPFYTSLTLALSPQG